jgi:hypothetical protein
MSAQTVLEELTTDELTRDHVRRRVDDWSSRIDSLYEQVQEWLPNGWAARPGASVPINEELMRKTGEPARALPTLVLLHEGTVAIKIRPYGLWIVGANGWIDLVKGDDIYVISDRARTFEPPDWHIAGPPSRQVLKPFDREQLRVLLAS